MIIVSAITTARHSGDRDRLAELLADVRSEILGEPGVVDYRISIDFSDPRVLYSLEIYTSAEAVAAHMDAPHMRKIIVETCRMNLAVDVRAWADAEPFDIGAMIDAASD